METAFNLTVQGGFAFGYSAFLNGIHLGSNQGTPTISLTTDVWTIPNNTLRIGGDNVLTVFQGMISFLFWLSQFIDMTRSYGVCVCVLFPWLRL